MIYGPYKRQSKLRSIKPAQRKAAIIIRRDRAKPFFACARLSPFALPRCSVLAEGCCIWIMRQGRRGAYMLRMFRQFGNLS